MAVLEAHDVRWFLYNGGNDSADTALKLSELAEEFGYPLTCVGVPKTIDNDLVVTDCCPGFGSAAKYTAVSVRECALDVAAVADTSTKVFVYEAMGRNAGWLAASAGLAGRGPDEAPHLILFPERAYDEPGFLAAVQHVVARVGWCVVVASEGLRTADQRHVADAGAGKDAFGHTQLGGVASFLAGRVKDELGLKVHWTLPDYLQRSARHVASQTDLEQALAVGTAAVTFALAGHNAIMPVINRTADAPYAWDIAIAVARQDRQPGKEAPTGFHPARRLRHHPLRPALPRATDRRRSPATLRPHRYPRLRRAEKLRRPPQACTLAERGRAKLIVTRERALGTIVGGGTPLYPLPTFREAVPINLTLADPRQR